LIQSSQSQTVEVSQDVILSNSIQTIN